MREEVGLSLLIVRVVIIRHQTEENWLKQGGTIWTPPIRHLSLFLAKRFATMCPKEQPPVVSEFQFCGRLPNSFTPMKPFGGGGTTCEDICAILVACHPLTIAVTALTTPGGGNSARQCRVIDCPFSRPLTFKWPSPCPPGFKKHTALTRFVFHWMGISLDLSHMWEPLQSVNHY